jgi:hypothetical protein
LTIVENANIGVRDGRTDTPEHQGWYTEALVAACADARADVGIFTGG